MPHSDLRAAFDADGFVIVPDLLPASRMAALKDAVQETLSRKGDHGGVFVGLSADAGVFRDLHADPAICDALQAVGLGSIEFLSDKVVFKSRDTGYASPWHQDYPYWRGRHKVSVWLALDDADERNGCMRVLPGSHRSERVHDAGPTEAGTFGNSVRPETLDLSRAVTAAVPAGGAVIFHDLLLHASHPNRTGEDRYAWIGTYRDAAPGDLDYDWAVAARIVR